MKSLTKYVVFSIVTLLIYTAISQIIFWQTGAEYGTLTACFFAAFGGEILMCALIKIFKLKGEPKQEEPPEETTFTSGYVSDIKEVPVETPTYTYTTSTTEEEPKG